MKYNVLRLYISAFHPKANVIDDLAGLLAYSVVDAFPYRNSGMEIQQPKGAHSYGDSVRF
jgi:hypothetical protein